MLTKLRAEPVRAYLYAVLTAVLVVLLTYGVLSGEQVDVWLGLGGAVLAVPAVETARAKVTPVGKR